MDAKKYHTHFIDAAKTIKIAHGGFDKEIQQPIEKNALVFLIPVKIT